MSEELQVNEQVIEQEIQLPQDYDAYYGVTGLNQEIRNLISQAIEARDSEHAAEVDEIVQTYKGRLEEAEKVGIERGFEIDKLRGELRQANEAKREAEEKRDNAVRMMEEAQEAQKKSESETQRLRDENESLKSQINELEGMLRTYKAKKPTGGLHLTSTLPSLSEEELKAKREREQLEFINRRLQEKFGGAVEPIDIPPLPNTEGADEVTEESLQEQMKRVEDAAQADAETFPVVPPDTRADTSSERAKEAHEDASGVGEEADAPTLEERVSYLEAQMKEVVRRVGILEGDFRDHIGLP